MPHPLQHHPKGAPGSPKAIKNGCTCPVVDNGHGKGYYVAEDGVPVYVVLTLCKIHGESALPFSEADLAKANPLPNRVSDNAKESDS